ncbi:unnamed protein product [Aspergillus oryzae var. brunneus]|uniref:Unnamed protein product n=2 Tax=Aspergillus oryzae TaxID=5062 RepID=A0AAN4YIR8_ASPOZ|nr:unnamed protein product [Aspergillus oryzae]GMG49686.1 unnamed protein product [Aspergillus oryzae var. brunneus]
MVDTSNPNPNDTAMDTVVPKTEPAVLEGSISSAVSTPEAEGEILTQDVAQTQKRKGGRKPVPELRLKAGAPGPKPNPMAGKPPSTLERAALNRNSAQRHPPGIAPKGEPFGMPQPRDGAYGIPSPQFQATPQSHVSSPSHAKSPGFAFQGAMSPAGVDPQQAAQHSRLSHSRNLSQTSPPMSVAQSDTTDPKSALSGGAGPRGPRVASAYYPSPFQKHYDQLEQEYDAQADLIDEEHDSSVGASPYVSGFNNAASVPGSHSMGHHSLPQFNPHSGEGSNGAYNNTNQLLGNYEPMLDADPFGLSASMHFQTPFSYEQNNTRH